MKYRDYLREDMRLVMLRLLEESPSYKSNSSILYKGLEMMGHVASRDQVITECDWLNEQGFIVLEKLETIYVITLTERGLDIATGKTHTHGIARPRPQ